MLPQNLIVTSDIASDLEGFFKENHYSKVAVLVDENTGRYCLPLLKDFAKNTVIIKIQSGEKHKNLQTCDFIWKSMIDQELDRSSVLINLGGGVVCDMGGFCAATFKRGVEFINVPTSLLAQVDASFGGKTGVDFLHLKNILGVFSEPIATMIDTAFLKTLEERQIRSGFAEMLKHGLIADKEYFEWLMQSPYSSINWEHAIEKSIEIKYAFVIRDPFEEADRKALNFGHTIGHAVETHFLAKNEDILHGEAIALGMICESFISKEKLGLSGDSLTRIGDFLSKKYDTLHLDEKDIRDIKAVIRNDKKNRGGRILMSLIPEIGEVKVNVEVLDEDIEKSFSFYNNLNS